MLKSNLSQLLCCFNWRRGVNIQTSGTKSNCRSVQEVENKIVAYSMVENKTFENIPYDLYRSQNQRLSSFTNVISRERAIKFAKAAFFRVRDKLIQCPFCLITVHSNIYLKWKEPMLEHQLTNPNCPFICNLPVGNVI